MPVVHVATWPVSDEKARTLTEQITRTVHGVTGAPLDKISVYLTEVSPDRWADAGVIGSDPDFRERSRRLSYGDGE